MELLKDGTVAERLFTTRGTLAKWRLRGIGPPFVKIGPRGIAYPKGELEDWLQGNLQTSTSGGGRGGRRKAGEK